MRGEKLGWLTIALAPEGAALELAEMQKEGIVPWRFPCRRARGVWFNIWADQGVLIHPTHFRIWRQGLPRSDPLPMRRAEAGGGS